MHSAERRAAGGDGRRELLRVEPVAGTEPGRQRTRVVEVLRPRVWVRNHVNHYVWKPALVAAGVEPSRENGCHALRHYYASVLLDAGENISAVSEYLGHSDPGFTPRTYTHLMPTSSEQNRKAVDDAFARYMSATSEPDEGVASRADLR